MKPGLVLMILRIKGDPEASKWAMIQSVQLGLQQYVNSCRTKDFRSPYLSMRCLTWRTRKMIFTLVLLLLLASASPAKHMKVEGKWEEKNIWHQPREGSNVTLLSVTWQWENDPCRGRGSRGESASHSFLVCISVDTLSRSTSRNQCTIKRW